MKTCSKCKVEKEDNCFSPEKRSKDGLQYWCKDCKKQLANKESTKEKKKQYRIDNKDHKKQYDEQYRIDNKEEIKIYNKQYRIDNKEEIKVRGKQYRTDNKEEIKEYKVQYEIDNKEKRKQYRIDNKEEIKIYNKQYRIDNKEKIKEYKVDKKVRNKNLKNKRENDPVFKLRQYISNAVRASLKERGLSKKGESVIKHLFYFKNELVKHIENQFEYWMNWNNQGVYDSKTWNDNDPTTWKWQLDHIIPQSHLPFDSMEHENFKECWALENLRPYSAKQNILDSNRR